MIFGGWLVSPPSSGGRFGPPSGPTDPRDRPSGPLGMALFLAALAMLFGASILLFLLTRARFETWPPAGTPKLPRGLWLSTAIIVACSIAIHIAQRAARRGAQPALRRWVCITGVLGLAFLVAQTVNWIALVQAGVFITQRNAFTWMFYFLTGVHAAHVLGGLIPLAIVTVGAFRGRYGPRNHAGVTFCAAYWHFLDVVWLVLVAVLMM